MSGIYLSAYCVDFRDYAWLEGAIRSFGQYGVGAELAAGYEREGFDALLEAQAGRFRDLPVTLHAPFIEWCTVPGSKEEKRAQAEFEKACRLYGDFHASSIVFHTHEGSFEEGKKEEKRRRSAEVLREFAGRMDRAGMRATVENVGYPALNNVLFNEEEFVGLFAVLPPQMGCLVDIGHALLNGWDMENLIRTLGTRIWGYHLNQNDGRKDLHFPIYDPRGICSPGRMDEILKTIARCSPEADLILEYAPGPKISREGLLADIRRVSGICGK